MEGFRGAISASPRIDFGNADHHVSFGRGGRNWQRTIVFILATKCYDGFR